MSVILLVLETLVVTVSS